MTHGFQCDLTLEVFNRLTAVREKLGMSKRSLMERILLEALPRWEQVNLPGAPDA